MTSPTVSRKIHRSLVNYFFNHNLFTTVPVLLCPSQCVHENKVRNPGLVGTKNVPDVR